MTSAAIRQLQSELEALVPADPRERRSIGTLLATLIDQRRPFDRDASATHVTASSIIVGPRGTVLHLHKRVGAWLQPGGHIDPGETPWDAAVRESAEETGLLARHPAAGPLLLHVDVAPAANDHVHLDVRYVLVADDTDPVPGEHESPDARWFSWDGALAVADESLRGALLKARAWSR